MFCQNFSTELNAFFRNIDMYSYKHIYIYIYIERERVSGELRRVIRE